MTIFVSLNRVMGILKFIQMFIPILNDGVDNAEINFIDRYIKCVEHDGTTGNTVRRLFDILYRVF